MQIFSNKNSFNSIKHQHFFPRERYNDVTMRQDIRDQNNNEIDIFTLYDTIVVNLQNSQIFLCQLAYHCLKNIVDFVQYYVF